MKEAGVHRRSINGNSPWCEAGRPARFTLSDARRALPYVARIVADVCASFHEIQNARFELLLRTSTTRREELNATRDAALRRLNAAIDECNAVGADILDIAEGVVRFNAEVNGRRCKLLWRLGQPVDNAWPQLASDQAISREPSIA